MTKHTPGPWEVRERFYIGRPGRMSLAEVKCGDVPADDAGQHEANARLIAAAPELLAACKSLDEAQRYYGEHAYDKDGMPGNAFYSEMFMAVVRLAREAILKAEGAAR